MLKKATHKWKLNWLDASLALFIFILTVASFYGLLYMTRECIRYFSITYEYDIWILSEKEVQFYNRFYAAIALIMAMGAVSSFLTNRPSFGRGSIKERTQILNDSRVLNWVFIMWTAELAIILGILFTAMQIYYEFSLYPNYRFLFILFVIVLYLQQWTNFARLFTKLRTKIFIPVTIVFTLLVYLLGSINLIDYEKINSSVLNKNPYHKLSITKPSSSSWTQVRRYSMTPQLFLGFPRNVKGAEPILMDGNGLEIGLNHINSIASKWKRSIPEIQHPALMFQLNVDESIPMRHVNEIKDAIVQSEVYKIGYSVVPENTAKNGQMRYKRVVIPAKVLNYNFIDSMFPDRLMDKEIYDVLIKPETIVIDGVEKSKNEFAIEIERIITSNPTYHFNLTYGNDINYGRFIEYYSELSGSIQKARNDYSMAQYGKKYAMNTRGIQQEIRKRYPLAIEDSEYQKR